MTNLEAYLAPIRQLGIQLGDVLFVSSDIKRLLFGYYEQYDEMPSLDDIIDYLQQLIGEEGTLIFPTYNWGFCRGTAWDYNKTKCETGSLSTAALKRKDFRRTLHPIYSFAVWGKGQEELCQLTNTSSFGFDSPFAWLDKTHAKNLIIDVSFTNCLTFVHYVEQLSGVVNYRYEKNFTADYTDAEGRTCARTYSMFVRDLDLDVENDFDSMEEQLLVDGIAQRMYINEIPITLLDMHNVVEPILADVKHNRSRKLCKYKGQ